MYLLVGDRRRESAGAGRCDGEKSDREVKKENRNGGNRCVDEERTEENVKEGRGGEKLDRKLRIDKKGKRIKDGRKRLVKAQ